MRPDIPPHLLHYNTGIPRRREGKRNCSFMPYFSFATAKHNVIMASSSWYRMSMNTRLGYQYWEFHAHSETWRNRLWETQAIYKLLLLTSYESSSVQASRTHPTGREFPYHTLISFSVSLSLTHTHLLVQVAWNKCQHVQKAQPQPSTLYVRTHTDTQLVEKEGKARILAVQTAVSRGSRTMSQQGKLPSSVYSLTLEQLWITHQDLSGKKNGARKPILERCYACFLKQNWKHAQVLCTPNHILKTRFHSWSHTACTHLPRLHDS